MNKVEISHRIEDFFNKLGWTKKKFAEALNEYPQNLNKVFEGKLDPLKYVNSLAEIGCDINWLLTGQSKYLVRDGRIDYTAFVDTETTEKSIGAFLAYIRKLEEENKALRDENFILKKKLQNNEESQ